MSRMLIALIVALSCVQTGIASEPKEKNKGGSESADEGVFPQKKENNLIANPGFENKTSKWVLGKINGGAGMFTTDTISPIAGQRSAKIFTSNHDREVRDLALFTFMPLKKGTNYTFSFQAEVKGGCLITVSFDNGDKSYFTEELWLQPRLTKYGPYTFTAEEDDIFNRLCFNLGKTNTVIRLDDIQINAEYTEKEFEETLVKSGVNLQYIHDAENNSIHVSLSTKPVKDIPFMICDEKNNVIYANKLTNRNKEATITLNRKLYTGNYRLDLYLASRRESIDLFLK